MSAPDDNPFRPPTPTSALPVDRVAARATPVTSVTFRYSHQDLKRANAFSIPTRSHRALLLVIIVLVILFVLSRTPEDGWTLAATVPMGLAFAFAAVVLLVGVLRRRVRGLGPSEAPFDSTFELTPAELIIREPGITEIRRSWPSVADISADRNLIRFDFVYFDTSTGRYISRPSQVVPIRAFDSEDDAASFLATARSYREASGPTLSAE